MALYSFIKDAGTKIPEMGDGAAHTETESSEKTKTSEPKVNSAAAEAILDMLQEFHLELKGPSVIVEADVVHITGMAKNQEIREKIILAVGNVQGVAQVDEKIELKENSPESRFHTVERADSLKNIAEKVYDDPEKYQLILEANRPLLKEEKDIYPGQVLRVPEVE